MIMEVYIYLEMCQFAKHEWLAGANHGLRKDFEDKAIIFPRFDSITLGNIKCRRWTKRQNF